MKERTLEGFLEAMEKELQMTIDAMDMLREKRFDWTEGDYKQLITLIELKEKQEQTIRYIKQYRRGLI